MAERPIFIPAPQEPELVQSRSLTIAWAGGFAPSQKQKNVRALHEAAAAAGYDPVLEISTKSEHKLGRHLGAFHLQVRSAEVDTIPLESAFQGSKVFELGGPNTDLYRVDARTAKRDPRLQTSGRILAFVFDGFRFPVEPKTVFYDWLYVSAIFPHRDWLKPRLRAYAAFSDIEFNPTRSINCQARSCALFVSLMENNLLEEAVESPAAFVDLMTKRVRAGDIAHV